jgi:predicted PurR-regulated permease PerM
MGFLRRGKHSADGDRDTYEPIIHPARRNFTLVRDEDMWNWAVRFSTVGLFIIALGVILRLLEHIVVPLVLAWVIATVLLPVVNQLSRFHVPRALAAVSIVLLLLIAIAAVLIILTVPLSYWLSRADELGQLLKAKMELIHQPLKMLEELQHAINPVWDDVRPPPPASGPTTNILTTMLGILTPAVDEFLIFVIALVFNLIYQQEIKNGIVALVRDQEAKELTRNVLADIELNMSSYFGTVTIVNVFLGVATAGIAALLGFPHPLLWGVLAAVMNYIPYLGPVLVLVAFFVVGVVVFPTLHEAFLAPLLFLALTTLEGQVITPAFIGHRLTINPFLVFLSIAFWTWMWGPLGAFVAVPLLVSAMVAARHIFGNRQASAA